MLSSNFTSGTLLRADAIQQSL